MPPIVLLSMQLRNIGPGLAMCSQDLCVHGPWLLWSMPMHELDLFLRMFLARLELKKRMLLVNVSISGSLTTICYFHRPLNSIIKENTPHGHTAQGAQHVLTTLPLIKPYNTQTCELVLPMWIYPLKEKIIVLCNLNCQSHARSRNRQRQHAVQPVVHVHPLPQHHLLRGHRMCTPMRLCFNNGCRVWSRPSLYLQNENYIYRKRHGPWFRPKDFTGTAFALFEAHGDKVSYVKFFKHGDGAKY